MALRRAGRVGISLSPTRMYAQTLSETAAGGGAPDGWIRDLQPSTDSGTGWHDLEAAFVELRESMGIRSGSAYIALLPPYSQVRRLELPLLRDHELRHVLSRDAARYFPAVREPQVVGAALVNGNRRSPAAMLASAASARLVDSIVVAAEQSGWDVESVVPGCAAWAAASRHVWPELRRGPGNLVVMCGEFAELLELRNGRVAIARRLMLGGSSPERICAALDERMSREQGEQPLPLALAGDEPIRRSLSELLTQRGRSLLDPRGHTELTGAPEALAARFAAAAESPELLPERIHEARGQRSRRATIGLIGVTLAMVILAAGLQLWGYQRELAAIREQREAIRPLVDEVTAVQASIDGVIDRLDHIGRADERTPSWSDVIAQIAENLPEDAHLTSFRVRGDTLTLTGLATDAAGALDGLRLVERITGLRADGPIQRQMQDGEPPIERFSVTGHLHRPFRVAQAETP